MVFVTVDEDRLQLQKLTGLLVHTFPGSVIYQYSDPMCAVLSTADREIDAVFASARTSRGNDLQLLSVLGKERPGLQLIVLSDDEQLRQTAMESGAWRYLRRPATGQELYDAMYAV
ncbi:MAG: hypothetical protein ACI3XG_10815 [Faecousia sp.]